MFKSLFLAFAVLASLFVSPSLAAEASPRAPYNGKVVEVVSHLSSSWPVKAAVSDVDYYTGSSIHIVKKCSGKHDCVTISTGNLPGKAVGATGWCSYKYTDAAKQHFIGLCKIVIDTKLTSKSGRYGYYTKRWLVRHELGHWRGLGHSKGCVSTMNPVDRCHGHVPPAKFTSHEKSILRKN